MSMSCCGRPRTLMREAEEGAPADRTPSAPAAPGAVGARGTRSGGETGAVVRLRYIGGASALISGPATLRTYRFTPLQPVQLVDVRDSIAMLRTRLFVRSW